MVKQSNEESIFDFARRIESEEMREEYLGQVCGDDDSLRNRLKKLLSAHNAESDLWDLGLSHTGPTIDMPAEEEPDRMIGRYKVREKIGEGGMGVVFVAEQAEPIKRRVALKLIKPGMDSKDVLARFEAERQALALMSHRNIAKVFDAGKSESGRPYFVMELVRGLPITEYCDIKRMGSQQRLRLFIDICNAVQHAHQKGIIHRDLKPSNVLVTEQDGEPIVKVIDFGVAKAINRQLTDATVYTRFQQFVGTPMYMSPEQAALSSVDVDTRSDIYSLGVLLYELLTGTTPYDREKLKSASFDEVRRIIQEEEPSKPSTKIRTMGDTAKSISDCRGTDPIRLSQTLNGDLDWIVMKALDKERSRRYDTSRGFANDILRYMNDELVVARPPSTIYRIEKLARRHKVLFATSAAILLSLIAGLVATTTQAIRAAKAENRAHTAQQQEQWQRELAETAHADADKARQAEHALREQAEADRLYVRRRAYASDMNLSMLALKENNFGRARQLLNRQRPSSGEADLRCWEWRLLWQQCQGDVLFKLPRHGNSVNALAFCSDSRLLASGDWDGIIRIHEVGTGRETQRMKDADPVRGLKFIHGDTQLISGGSQISIWDVKSGEVIDSIELSARCRAFDVAPDDSTFAAITTNHKAVIGDLATRKLLAEFPTKNIYGDHPGQIAYSRDSQQVAIGDLDGTLKIIDIPSLKPVQEFEAHRIGITALAFSPDGRQIATSAGYSSQAIRLWDVETGELQSEKAGHTEWVSSLAYTDDGKKLFSTSADQTVRVWDVAGDAPTKTLRGHELEVWSIATSPNKQLFASGGKDGTVHLWTQNAETHDVPYVTSSIPLKDAQFFGDSKRILVLKNDNTIAIWDTATLQEKELLTELGNDNTAIHMSPDSRWCLAVTRNLDIKVYEFKRESIITRLSAQSPAAEITVLADGKTLAVSDPGSIRFWSTDTWDQVREFSMAGPQRPLIVSPSGKLGGYASGGRVHLWDIEANKRIGKKQAHKRGGHFAFSHDSKLMASVSNDGSMGMWTTDESMSSNGPLSGHLKGVHSVLFTPDNSRLVTGSGDHEIIRLWDIATNEQVATLSGEGYLVYQLRCSLDGNALAAINSEGKLHVWRPPTWEEIQAKERLAISR